MTSFRLSVPANLLLAGEYAVLEENGLGWALAVHPRLTVTVKPQHDWVIRGVWPGGGESWRLEDGPEKAGFAGKLFLALFENFSRVGGKRLPPAQITIDSSPFFDQEGRKSGLGSSAALAVGLACALAKIEGRAELTSVHHQAVWAHRQAQGGRGSGYDVTTSLFGGLGLFCGGERPQWTPDNPAKLPELALFPGRKAVKTVSAIGEYQKWKASHAEQGRDFLAVSNRAVQQAFQADSPPQVIEAWKLCRQLGLHLGEEIGVSAKLETADADQDSSEVFFKALGAGNETGLMAGSPSAVQAWLSERPDAVRLKPSMAGVREE